MFASPLLDYRAARESSRAPHLSGMLALTEATPITLLESGTEPALCQPRAFPYGRMVSCPIGELSGFPALLEQHKIRLCYINFKKKEDDVRKIHWSRLNQPHGKAKSKILSVQVLLNYINCIM